MEMVLNIDNVIYFYIFICIALLLFNVFYIFRSKGRDRKRAARQRRWEELLRRELAGPVRIGGEGKGEGRRIFDRLKSTEELMAFNEVMGNLFAEKPGEVHSYFRVNRTMFRELAAYYGRKSAMERAFFAYVIASYHPPLGREHDMLVEILLTYMEGSTVFCRENVLQALYALGSERGVEHVFQLLSVRGWYHHPRLLSDGMAEFAGDKEALVSCLWRHRKEWEDFLLVATVQFASGFTGSFAGEFLEALERERLPLEVRFSLVRYLQRHHYEPARLTLLRYVTDSEGEENGLAIAAAAALTGYPGEGTKPALKKALLSRDWYVRHNAASSLAALGLSESEFAEIITGGDRYAAEMLSYVAEEKAEKTAATGQGVVV